MSGGDDEGPNSAGARVGAKGVVGVLAGVTLAGVVLDAFL